jgi:hypothetical protein
MKKVYDMSFAEFQIRLFAYKRVQEREWDRTRFVAWYAMKGSHLDPKKMPKSMTNFMRLSIDNKKHNKVSDEMKSRFMAEMAKYVENTKK